MSKLKNAPYLKKQGNNYRHEQSILIGPDAWDAYGKGDGVSWQLLCDLIGHEKSKPPVILNNEILSEINLYRVANEKQEIISFYQFGEVDEKAITALCVNIAHNTCAKILLHCDRAGQMIANLSDYLERIRQGDEIAQAIAEQVAAPVKEPRNTPYIDERTENGINGLFYVVPKIDKATGDITGESTKWLSSPVEVVGVGKSEQSAYVVLRFTPENENKPVTTALSLELLGEREGWKQLRKQGLKIANDSKSKNILADHFQSAGKRTPWTITELTGWHGGAYLLPNGEVIGEPARPVLFAGQSAAVNGYDTRGTLESWRENVGNYLKGNHSMILGVGASLAAPLLGLLEADNFGIHLYGGSSTGKTTTANIASTIYGHPDKTRLTWYGTAYAVSNEALAHNDNFMAIDEIGQAEHPKHVKTSLYSIFNGVSKNRGEKEVGNKPLTRWRTVVLSTGEKDVETFLMSEGIRVQAGQLVRLINIPIRKAENFHTFANAKAHADHLNEACKENYGVIGREWVKHLSTHKESVKANFKMYKEKWLKRVPQGADAQIYRVADKFALIETALKMAANFTAWESEIINEALIVSFNDWLNVFGTRSKEEEQVLEQVIGFIDRYRARFVEIPRNPNQYPPTDAAGYVEVETPTNSAETFYIFPVVYKNEVIAGFNDRQASEILYNNGILKKDKSKNAGYTQKMPYRIDKKRAPVYVIMPYCEP
ncbi:DUF927 domain-containing protein [Pasteurellaceae bacterium HPA106]|uniref:DUF927 domain-containing protein n=1 Tax=Spirabiliibacterium pneumoniae TaxID=221400 RepID=UPI001AADDB47|nr:DUF927 domain-containing protein [Spirabiliibacterium pneumoniae]MBE2896581.1 DUF927 domain-containing protein [Spirabiliibacterium pneumoniae]